MNILLLGSKSLPRQKLLQDACIPFVLADQNADEQVCRVGKTLQEIVLDIALQKMQHVVVPFQGSKPVFILTADTMVQDAKGRIFGKPVDYQDAALMIQAARDGMTLATAFCLERRIAVQVERIAQVVTASYAHHVPDELIPWVLENSISMQCAGGFTIEGIGLQFMKDISGSFSALLGLPLYEVRQALVSLGFFDSHI